MQQIIQQKLGLDFYEASKIYTPYIGSCRIEWEIKGTTHDCIKDSDFTLFDANWFLQKYRCTLFLKDVKNISDEDCFEFIKILGLINHNGFITEKSPKRKQIDSVKHFLNNTNIIRMPLNVCQFLQSKGYALPYIDFTIEQLVDVEIYKIID